MGRKKTLIVGCGYLGERVARLLLDRGDRVFGTTRSLGRAIELSRLGIEATIADVLTPESLARLPEVDRVLYCVGFDRSQGVPIREVYVDGLEHVLEHLAGRAGHLVYAGSTGVYGQDDGSWVDEDSPTEPRSASGRACLEAEETLRSCDGLSATIIRYAGLYGPGRIMRRESLLKGEPIAGDPAKFLNLIHIDDAACVAVAALDQGQPGSLYLASDNRPATRLEFYSLAAQALGAPEPRFEPAEAGSGKAGRDESNKRVSNARLRSGLNFEFTFPEITTGVPAAIGISAVA